MVSIVSKKTLDKVSRKPVKVGTNQLVVRNKRPISNNKLQAKRPIIQVKNLIKKYQNFVAVNSITFDVKPGEIFGILGPNGAGKTTTLEIIETLSPKTDGQVLVDGLDIDIYPKQVKQSIGIQLQSGGFYPRLNLIEQIELFATIYGVKVKPLEILQTVALEDKKYHYVDTLSGGSNKDLVLLQP
jgi:ABC-2 type transport system ATP-binding protein